MPRRWNLIPMIVISLAVSACASTSEDGEPDSQAAEVRVIVRNDAFWDANIYLMRGGQRERLGMVSGHSSQTFVLPRHMVAGVAEVQFAVDWIGRRDVETSQTIVAVPGDEIELIIR